MHYKNIFSLLVLLAMTPTVHAAAITFSNFSHLGSDDVDYIVTVSDDTAGVFTISYQVNPLSVYTTAKFTGFFFDVADPFVADNSPYHAGNLGLVDISAPASCGQGFNTNHVSGAKGCNSNIQLGSDAGAFAGHLFDVGIAWKNDNDLSGGGTGSFQIADLGLGLADWVMVGLRGQATTGAGGSAKEFQYMANTVVPVPAALWLFGSGFLGLMAVARRR